MRQIEISPEVCHGQPRVAGTRMPVAQVLRMLAAGDSVEALLGAYPYLRRRDIAACLEFGARMVEEQRAGRGGRGIQKAATTRRTVASRTSTVASAQVAARG